MWFFIALAILGLIASAVVHASTFFGIDPQAVFPPVFLLLHVGIFVVWIPAVVLQRHGAPAETRFTCRDCGHVHAEPELDKR